MHSREQASPIVSLVAEKNDAIIGHIMFSPVYHLVHRTLRITGLAPMAVAPGLPAKGCRSALVRAGLEQCRELGFLAAVVLGHPEYCPRFEFLPSTNSASNQNTMCQRACLWRWSFFHMLCRVGLAGCNTMRHSPASEGRVLGDVRKRVGFIGRHTLAVPTSTARLF